MNCWKCHRHLWDPEDTVCPRCAHTHSKNRILLLQIEILRYGLRLEGYGERMLRRDLEQLARAGLEGHRPEKTRYEELLERRSWFRKDAQVESGPIPVTY